jgi:AcrR family transcriptional regulator
MSNSILNKKARKPNGKEATFRGYHHGDLRKALINACVHLIEHDGLEAVSVREVAKLVGVSPAAPFRHFATRTALLTAVAEEAQERLGVCIAEALRAAAEESPLMQFRAIGVGFLQWSFANPTHFQVISSRAVIDYEGSRLRGSNDLIRAKMHELMRDAASLDLLRPGDIERYQIAARAMVYGLARMYIDGQFPSWGLPVEGAQAESIKIFDLFIASISTETTEQTSDG